MGSALIGSTLFSASIVDDLLQRRDVSAIKRVIGAAQVIDDERELPDRPQEGDCIIMENDYDIKLLYEYHDGQWNEKVDPLIAKLLENDRGTTYKNLFNYKLNASAFDPYISDNFKHTSTASQQRIGIKMLYTDCSEKDMSDRINAYLQTAHIDTNQIINIEISGAEKKQCRIIVIYKQ
jgi:hypothetical protein